MIPMRTAPMDNTPPWMTGRPMQRTQPMPGMPTSGPINDIQHAGPMDGDAPPWMKTRQPQQTAPMNPSFDPRMGISPGQRSSPMGLDQMYNKFGQPQAPRPDNGMVKAYSGPSAGPSASTGPMGGQSNILNGLLFPTFNKGDWTGQSARNNSSYQTWSNDDFYNARLDPDKVDSWSLNKDLAQQYWGAGDRTISGGIGDASPWQDTNYWPQFDEQGNLTNLTIKSAGGHGTSVPYKVVNGQYVPDLSTARMKSYETNPGDENRGLLTVALAALGGAALAPGGAAAGGIGAEAGAGMLAPVEGAAGIGGYGASAAGGIGAAEGAGMLAPVAEGGIGAEAGAGMLAPVEGVAGIGGGAGATPWLDYAKQGYGALKGLGGLFGGGQRTGPSGGFNLGDLLSGYYGKEAAGQYADQLRGIASGMRADADPYLTKLRESYENPQAYLDSPEMKARLGLEANKYAGIDAASGRLSNDIDRTKKLQDYGMSAVGQYRQGLNQSLQSIYQPRAIADLYKEAAGKESSRYGSLLAGAGSATGGVNWDDIVGIIDKGGDWWDSISDWWDTL